MALTKMVMESTGLANELDIRKGMKNHRECLAL